MLITGSKIKPLSVFDHITRNKLAFAFLAVLSITIALYFSLPIFTNKQATSHISEYYSDIKYRYDEMGTNNLAPVLRRAATETVRSNTQKYLTNQSIPNLNINIDFTSWEAIKNQRNDMLGKIFMGSVKTFHKASIQYNGKTIPIKIRLKGGRSDHIDSPKRWSFRIKTRKGKSLFGMKIFALQHPKTRGYHREAVFHQLAQQFGILSLNYFYVSVSINGEDVGIMALEEVPAKEMLERQEKKEGLLYKFSDQNITHLYHATVSSLIKDNPAVRANIYNLPAESLYSGFYANLFRIYYNAINAPLKEISRKEDGEAYQRQRPVAVGLLKGFLAGHIAPSKVIDAQKMGQYFGYLGLWGDSHAASFRNARYYFNPYTYKFEPILNDSNAYSSRKIRLYPNRQDIRDHEINRLMMQDPRILSAYTQSVTDLFVSSQENDFSDHIRQIEKEPLSDLREEFWFLPELELTSMKASIKTLEDEIQTGTFFEKRGELKNDIDDPQPLIVPKNFHAPAVIDANLVWEDNKPFIEVHNLFPLEVKITSLTVKIDGRAMNGNDYLSESLPISIDAFYYNQNMSLRKIALKNLPIDSKIDISGSVSLRTQEQVSYSFTAGHSYPTLKSHPLESQSVDHIISRYPFISYDEITHNFRIAAGKWNINEFIIFPESASLTIDPGTSLYFEPKAGLLIKGSLTASGSKKQPITLNAANTKSTNTWAGVTVLQATNISTLDHVTINNASIAAYKNWHLSGAVNFYMSDVNIENSHFINTVAEDAVNIVHSNFTLIDSTIENTRSDGLDTDYSVGYISSSFFNNIGGDAIDFSGSKIQINQSRFTTVHDKAISAGENTEIYLDKISVLQSGTGLAVKDGSTANIRSSIFKDIQYSTMMSYTKKNTYGPALLIAKKIQYDDKNLAIVTQKGNTLILDGETIEPIKINIKQLYKKGYMKK
jgi:hypothetical protein